VLRESDCLSRERGIDLLLERHGAQLAIEVKGEVLLAAIRIHSKHPEYAVAVGFPDIGFFSAGARA
jgi:hypothetical protein